MPYYHAYLWKEWTVSDYECAEICNVTNKTQVEKQNDTKKKYIYIKRKIW